MNLTECLQFLDTLVKNNYKSSLLRFKQKLQQLNCYPHHPKIFTVAGTNGKGTTCATLESILLASGYQTGCYLSPHLLTITERFRVNGKNISEAQFCSAFLKVHAIYTNDTAREEMGWFEFITLLAMVVFAQHDLDFLILEIGIGGCNDVVNVIDPDVAVITSIALDHTEILGGTRELIGVQKSGIFRAHRPAVYAESYPPESVVNYAITIDATLLIYDRDYFYEKTESGWFWSNHELQSSLLPYTKFPLTNAAAAIAALLALPVTQTIPWTAISEGLQRAFLPGRFQIVKQQPLVICDVAHNPHAAHLLAEQLQQQSCEGTTYAIIGMQTKKDIPKTLAAMLKFVDKWYISDISSDPNSSANFVEIAAECLQHYKAQHTVATSIQDAIEQVSQAAQLTDRIIIFGSFLTVEEALQTKWLLP